MVVFMNNTIVINPAVRGTGEVWKAGGEKDGRQPLENFIDKLFEKDIQDTGTLQSGYGRPAFADEMTMAEYKQYIRYRIQQIPVNPSNRRDIISIQISDEGFAAMKNDPEYEKWVLASIKSSLGAYDPLGSRYGGKYVTLYFGAAKGEYRGEAWRPPYMDEDQRRRQKAIADRENERRAERKRRLKEQYKKLLEKRALEKSILEKKLQQKKLTEAWAARRREYSRFLQAWSIERYK